MKLFNGTLHLLLALAAGILYLSGVISGLPAVLLIGVATVFMLTNLIQARPPHLLFGITTKPGERDV